MNIIKTVRSLWKLDPFYMCYALSSEDITIFDDLPAEVLPPESIIRSIARYIYKVFFNKYACVSFKKRSMSDVWIYCDTANGMNAVEFLRGKLSEDYITSSSLLNGKILTRRSLLLALFYLPRLVYSYFTCSSLRKRVMAHYFDDYLLAYAVYISGCSMIYKYHPRIVLFTNDHSCNARAFFMAASGSAVKTLFIQHASFTRKMPPLDFDYALLDGINSLNNYVSKGICRSFVFLVGLPRVDVLHQNISKGLSIGICTTLLDDIATVEDVLSVCVATVKNKSVVLRYHPSANIERRNMWNKIAEKHGIKISNPQDESTTVFFSSVSRIIAGDCSILLESAVSGIIPVMYSFSSEFSDRYSYVENGLVQLLSDTGDLVNWLQKDVDFLVKNNSIALFAHTFGSVWMGRSHILAEKIIKGLIAKGDDFVAECTLHKSKVDWYEYRSI